MTLGKRPLAINPAESSGMSAGWLPPASLLEVSRASSRTTSQSRNPRCSTKKKEGGINLVENCHEALCDWILSVLALGRPCITLGNTIICSGECNLNTVDWRGIGACYRHEHTHVQQYRDRGFVQFLREYLGEQAEEAIDCLVGARRDCDYVGNNRFEEEADENE